MAPKLIVFLLIVKHKYVAELREYFCSLYNISNYEACN